MREHEPRIDGLASSKQMCWPPCVPAFWSFEFSLWTPWSRSPAMAEEATQFGNTATSSSKLSSTPLSWCSKALVLITISRSGRMSIAIVCNTIGAHSVSFMREAHAVKTDMPVTRVV